MLLRWLDSVRREFTTLLTGSLLLSAMGFAQSLWHVPIPRWCYVLVFVCFLMGACYRAWRKESLVCENAKAEVRDLKTQLTKTQIAAKQQEVEHVRKALYGLRFEPTVFRFEEQTVQKRNDEPPHLSRTEVLIMEILLERPDGEFYGLELVRKSGGRLKRGTVYVALGRLEDKGFIEPRENVDPNMPGMPRRLYRVTACGQRVYELLRLATEARDLAAADPEGAM
jgi:DNA-binding PadR family transcriptional regulator